MAGKITVAGELYESITGQLFEIGRQLRQMGGYPYDPHLLKMHLQAAIEGRFGASGLVLRFDKRTEGWDLLAHQPRRVNESSQLELTSFLREGEERISGPEMYFRAIEQRTNLGQEDAEFLRLGHPGLLPKPPQGVWYVTFPGTLWRLQDGKLLFPCLDWIDGGWELRWHWVSRDWRSFARFLRLCN